MADKLTRLQFAQQVKSKYPQYKDIPDDRLVDSVLAKYPQYKDQIMDVQMFPPGQISGPLKGMAAVKAGAYSGVNRAADLVQNNFPAIAGTLGALLGGPGGAVLGGSAGTALEQLRDFSKGKGKTSSLDALGDIALGGVEQGAFELGGTALGKLGKFMAPADREAMIAFGTRSGELGDKLKTVLPDLDKTAGKMGTPIKTVGDLGKLVDVTKEGFNQEFNQALFPISGTPVAPQRVGSAIRSRITPNLGKTTEGKAMKAYLERRAREFELKNWTVGELNQERELVTRRLSAYHKAMAAGQPTNIRVDARMAADAEVESELKDILYNMADKSGTKPSGYFKELKQKQSVLIDFEKSIADAQKKLGKASIERKGAPLMEKIHLRTYLHPSSQFTPGGVAGLSPSMFTDPLNQANKAVAKGFNPTALMKARKAAALALSHGNVNAIPLRFLFADYSTPQESSP